MPADDGYPHHGSMMWFGATDYGMDTGPSAVAIVDLVLLYLCPTSVVDVGCGTGVFLDELEKRGVNTILGLDGPAAKEVFKPDRSSFLTVDLASPVRLNRRFDLALCLEVAEHLPADSADCLVEALTDLAPVVLFSAAHPSQGGQGRSPLAGGTGPCEPSPGEVGHGGSLCSGDHLHGRCRYRCPHLHRESRRSELGLARYRPDRPDVNGVGRRPPEGSSGLTHSERRTAYRHQWVISGTGPLLIK